MLLSSRNTVDNHTIEDLWLVSSEVVIGANIVKDIFARITDVIGGRSEAYETALKKAKDEAIKHITENAEELWADAVLGLKIDIYSVWWGMFMANALGTAVKTKKK